jgi:hypothetical protein
MVHISLPPMNRFWAALSVPRAQHKRIGKALALRAFIAGIAAGAGLYIGIDGLYVKVTTPPPSSLSAAQLPGAAAMAVIGADLAQSAAVRPAVQLAINSVLNCLESPSSAEATLRQANRIRQTILQGLQTLHVSGLPNGTQLVSVLTTAIQNSVKADNDYHAWLADLVSSGAACGSNPNRDPKYMAAGTASAAATTSKLAFVAIWNPMAPRYGQQTYTATGF